MEILEHATFTMSVYKLCHYGHANRSELPASAEGDEVWNRDRNATCKKDDTLKRLILVLIFSYIRMPKTVPILPSRYEPYY